MKLDSPEIREAGMITRRDFMNFLEDGMAHVSDFGEVIKGISRYWLAETYGIDQEREQVWITCMKIFLEEGAITREQYQNCLSEVEEVPLEFPLMLPLDEDE